MNLRSSRDSIESLPEQFVRCPSTLCTTVKRPYPMDIEQNVPSVYFDVPNALLVVWPIRTVGSNFKQRSVISRCKSVSLTESLLGAGAAVRTPKAPPSPRCFGLYR
jgi:hypothetical protein